MNRLLLVLLCLWPLVAEARTYSVEYRVTGSAPRAALAFYNESGGMDQIDVAVPWTTAFKAKSGAFLYLSAQNKDAQGDLRVEIVLSGKVVQSGSTNSEL